MNKKHPLMGDLEAYLEQPLVLNWINAKYCWCNSFDVLAWSPLSHSTLGMGIGTDDNKEFFSPSLQWWQCTKRKTISL